MASATPTSPTSRTSPSSSSTSTDSEYLPTPSRRTTLPSSSTASVTSSASGPGTGPGSASGSASSGVSNPPIRSLPPLPTGSTGAGSGAKERRRSLSSSSSCESVSSSSASDFSSWSLSQEEVEQHPPAPPPADSAPSSLLLAYYELELSPPHEPVFTSLAAGASLPPQFHLFAVPIPPRIESGEAAFTLNTLTSVSGGRSWLATVSSGTCVFGFLASAPAVRMLRTIAGQLLDAASPDARRAVASSLLKSMLVVPAPMPAHSGALRLTTLALSPPDLADILLALLLEAKLVLVSSSPGMLSSAALAALALLAPFPWPYVFVPIVPAVMTQYLAAPTPFIMGASPVTVADQVGDGATDVCVASLDGSGLARPLPDVYLEAPRPLRAAVIAAIVAGSRPELECADRLQAGVPTAPVPTVLLSAVRAIWDRLLAALPYAVRTVQASTVLDRGVFLTLTLAAETRADGSGWASPALLPWLAAVSSSSLFAALVDGSAYLRTLPALRNDVVVLSRVIPELLASAEDSELPSAPRRDAARAVLGSAAGRLLFAALLSAEAGGPQPGKVSVSAAGFAALASLVGTALRIDAAAAHYAGAHMLIPLLTKIVSPSRQFLLEAVANDDELMGALSPLLEASELWAAVFAHVADAEAAQHACTDGADAGGPADDERIADVLFGHLAAIAHAMVTLGCTASAVRAFASRAAYAACIGESRAAMARQLVANLFRAKTEMEENVVTDVGALISAGEETGKGKGKGKDKGKNKDKGKEKSKRRRLRRKHKSKSVDARAGADVGKDGGASAGGVACELRTRLQPVVEEVPSGAVPLVGPVVGAVVCGELAAWGGACGGVVVSTQPRLVLRGHSGPVGALAFASRAGLVSGGSDGRLCVWRADPERAGGWRGFSVSQTSHDSGVRALACVSSHALDEVVVSGGGDGAVIKWQLSGDGGSAEWVVTPHGRLAGGVRDLVVLSGAGLVVSGGGDGQVAGLSVANGSEAWRVDVADGAAVTAVAGTDDGGLVVAGDVRGGFVVLSGSDGTIAARVDLGSGAACVDAVGSMWACGTHGGTIVVGSASGLLATKRVVAESGSGAGVTALSWVSASRLVAAVDGSVRMWSVGGGGVLDELGRPALHSVCPGGGGVVWVGVGSGGMAWGDAGGGGGLAEAVEGGRVGEVVRRRRRRKTKSRTPILEGVEFGL
ncbi:uncharacterized protein AMSG_09278 [Thecamonas trahens ATCC 50062]|uniref:UDENN domain-containing protein n=1 Tax=Thecamonas trahens ATCC 50062 TaxID=461836 RepID=A0A0L0DLK6_THETB|nr:hypothetical protein AMSG_09278 [Thecamonas trahens ATCC 50062]KNC53194.1 hypothetical protein AMSG_09278 [Thecamonas trahens ATCC 50062]|eukprot:XP_013754665.1 hypothetical protein AMSG_09278 [Thecamonas trahens ATCC 50062]